MDLELVSKLVSLLVAAGSGSFAAVQAARSWAEKTRESRRASNERRMAELRRLIADRDAHKKVLDAVFDYSSDADHHLRIHSLAFSPDEAKTRSSADQVFEHFRDVHRSVAMGLIVPDDLGPWVYWIHRIEGRSALREYSEACGYGVFMADLVTWTGDSRELRLLRKKCPWWGSRERASVGA